MAKIQDPVSQWITVCLSNVWTTSGTWAQWNTGEHKPFVYVGSLLSPGVDFKAKKSRLSRIAKPFYIQPSVKHTMLVQTCGLASRQSGSDKPLTETWMPICYNWKGMKLRNTEQTAEQGPPIWNYLEKTWFVILFPGFISLPRRTHSGRFFWCTDVLVSHGIWSILHPFCSWPWFSYFRKLVWTASQNVQSITSMFVISI